MQLRMATADDFALLPTWFSDPLTLAEWGGPDLDWPLDAIQLAAMRHETLGTTPERIAVAGVEAMRVVAHGQLVLDRRNAVGRLARIAVAPDLRSRGLGERLVKGLVKIGFGAYGCVRLELNVYAKNLCARRLYSRCGFLEEGTRRSAVKLGSGREDMVLMACLAQESGSEIQNLPGTEH